MPESWEKVEGWLMPDTKIEHPGKEREVMDCKKNLEIPKLRSYETGADEVFWNKFPRKELPKKPKTRINVNNLQKLVNLHSKSLTKTELKRAERVIKDLREGADSCQLSELPAMATNNSATAFLHGELLTDKIASWVKEDFVCGPFEYPPMAVSGVTP